MSYQQNNSIGSSSLIYYLKEVRKRLLYCVLILSILFSILLYFSNPLYSLLAAPLLKFLPATHGLIATNVTSPFFVPLELSFVSSLFLAMPFFLYQLWAFMSPALYSHEKKILWPLLFLSSGLFYLGIAFAYFLVFPLLFHFIAGSTPVGVMLAPDIAQYLDFALRMLVIFGVIFEVPIIVLMLVWMGWLTTAILIKNRPYVIVAAFIVGMLIGPPEVLSQVLIAVPICFLYEIGLFLAKIYTKSGHNTAKICS